MTGSLCDQPQRLGGLLFVGPKCRRYRSGARAGRDRSDRRSEFAVAVVRPVGAFRSPDVDANLRRVGPRFESLLSRASTRAERSLETRTTRVKAWHRLKRNGRRLGHVAGIEDRWEHLGGMMGAGSFGVLDHRERVAA